MPATLPPGLPAAQLQLLIQTVDASPTKFVAVANLGDFTGPGQVATTVDVSVHGNKFFQYVKTLIDPGVLTCPVWFDETQPTLAGNAQALAELTQDNSASGFNTYLIAFTDSSGNIVATTGPQVLFTAWVAKCSWKGPVKGVYSADAEFRLSGKLTYLWPATVMPAGQTYNH